MLMSVSDLKDLVRTITDKEYDSFQGFPENTEEAAERWGNLLLQCCSEINPSSISLNEAKDSFINSYLSISSNPPNGSIIIPLAFNSFATTLNLGILNYVSSPPPNPINFDSLILTGISGAPAEQQASIIAQIIINWFKTGLYTPSGGNPIPWS